jgi:hypothetical protein
VIEEDKLILYYGVLESNVDHLCFPPLWSTKLYNSSLLLLGFSPRVEAPGFVL